MHAIQSNSIPSDIIGKPVPGKLTRYEICAKEINALDEFCLQFLNKTNAVTTLDLQMYEIKVNLSTLSINAFVSKKTQDYKLFNATVVF